MSEAVQLRVGLDVDLERGAVTLDENKSDDARAWALDPNVVRALTAWVELRGLEKGEPLFVGESNQPHETDRLAERLPAHLWLANVRREELHNTGTNRRQLRAHDLRGTFVTLSLANGRSETWVADRTGHKSSLMINRYRRAARSAVEPVWGRSRPSTRQSLSSVLSPRNGQKPRGVVSRVSSDHFPKNPLRCLRAKSPTIPP